MSVFNEDKVSLSHASTLPAPTTSSVSNANHEKRWPSLGRPTLAAVCSFALLLSIGLFCSESIWRYIDALFSSEEMNSSFYHHVVVTDPNICPAINGQGVSYSGHIGLEGDTETEPKRSFFWCVVQASVLGLKQTGFHEFIRFQVLPGSKRFRNCASHVGSMFACFFLCIGAHSKLRLDSRWVEVLVHLEWCDGYFLKTTIKPSSLTPLLLAPSLTSGQRTFRAITLHHNREWDGP